MPIFGGGTHPCISLRLSDMTKPINVLTGIDYWLDNLMSNVPEVVMCYHLNGIVQKYELIKTEDLPSMDNSKFSPKLIRDVAQNILSFLKSNATKAGHTYWLFKGKDEEVIKLYDLTSLCSSDMFDNDQNPFTVPVAMLLYKVMVELFIDCINTIEYYVFLGRKEHAQQLGTKATRHRTNAPQKLHQTPSGRETPGDRDVVPLHARRPLHSGPYEPRQPRL